MAGLRWRAEFLMISNIIRTAKKPVVATGDPNFSSVSLLLHMDGTNGSTSFVDNSSNALTVTAVGNAQISTAQAKSGFGQSGYFDGAGDYLTVANNAVFSMGTGPFTVAFWFYPLASRTNSALVDLRNSVGSSSGLLIRQGDGSSSGTTITCWAGTPGSTTPATCSGLIINAWNYICVTRDSSNSLTVSINGTSGTPVTRSVNLTDQAFRFGAFIDTTGSPNAAYGYFDDLQITKGVARTTAVPTAPFPNS